MKELLVVFIISFVITTWTIFFLSLHHEFIAIFPAVIVMIFAFRPPTEDFMILQDCSLNLTWLSLKIIVMSTALLVIYYKFI